MFNEEPRVNRKDIHTNFTEDGICDQTKVSCKQADVLQKYCPLLTLGGCFSSGGDQLPLAEKATHRHSPVVNRVFFCC